MNIIFYLIALMAAIYAFIALTGRNISTRWKRNYSFLQKINRTDPNRRAMIISSFTTHIIVALISLGFGLHEDGFLHLSESMVSILIIAFLVVIISAFLYTIIQSRKSK